MNNLGGVTLTSVSNFWLDSLSSSSTKSCSSSFPLMMYSSDFSPISFDAMQLSAVSPVFKSIFSASDLCSQTAWSKDNIAVIFSEINIETVKHFVQLLTQGDCYFPSQDALQQVKALIKCLAISCKLNDPKDLKEEENGNDSRDGMDEEFENDEDAKDSFENDVNELSVDSDESDSKSDENYYLENQKKRKSKSRTKINKKKDVSINCDECGSVINAERDSWEFMNHMSTHLGQKALQCTRCKFVLRDKKDWKNHMEVKSESGWRKYCCGLCGDVFRGQWNFLVHKRDAHEEGKPIRCETCNKVMTEGNEWRHHKFSVHAKEICQVCGVSLVRHALKKHMKTAHFYNPETDARPCRICGKEFKDELNRNIHEKGVHSNESIICDLCGKSYKSAITLSYHIEYKHKLERTHKCKMCSKAFKKIGELKRHELRHNTDGHFKCEVCDKPFTSKERLGYHVREFHSKIKFECTLCGKQFCTLTKAKMHCLIHNTAKIKSYQCGACQEWFENKDYGVSHVKNVHKNDSTKPTVYQRNTEEFQQLMKSCIKDVS